jgi:hypothetical protein
MLARLEIDEGDTSNDSVTFWVNPTLTGEVTDLEPQAIYRKTG